MSTAANRNFGIAVRERNRRIARGLDDPYDTTAQGGDLASDAFFGSLREMKDAAERAGMGFRADLGGIGRFDEPTQGGGRLTATDRAGLAGNIALGQMQDENAARSLAMKSAVDQYQQGAINDARQAYAEHVLNSVGQPAIERPMTTVATGAHGEDSYTMRPDPTEPVLTARQKLLASVPGSMRAAVEAQLGPAEQKDRALTEQERHQQEQDRIAAALAGVGDGSISPQEFTAEPPDPKTANIVDPRTGRTPAAIHQDALSYGLEGKLPALGLSSKGPGANAKAAIQNTAGAIADAAGVDLATVRQEFKNNQTVLGNLMPKYKMLSAASDTASKNLQLARDQSANVPRTGSPIVNRYSQFLLGKTLTGDPELTKLENYLYSAAREYAKVVGGGVGSVAEVSQSASKKAEELLNAAQTPEQLNAALDAMQHDMDNVAGPLLNQINQTSPNVARFLATARGKGAPAAGAPPASASPAPSGPGGGAAPRANPFRKQ